MALFSVFPEPFKLKVRLPPMRNGSFCNVFAPLLLLFLAFATTAKAAVCNVDRYEIAQSIVQIEQGGNYSTAVVVGKNRLITVAHAIDTQDSEITANIRGRYGPASPLLVYSNVDLALLEADTGNVPPMPIINSNIQLNENVWVTGFPLGRARTIESGTVSQIREDSVVTTARVLPGVSGGALMRCNVEKGQYELAGIVVSYLASVDGENITNTGNSVSLRMDFVNTLLNSSKEQLQTNIDFLFSANKAVAHSQQ